MEGATAVKGLLQQLRITSRPGCGGESKPRGRASRCHHELAELEPLLISHLKRGPGLILGLDIRGSSFYEVEILQQRHLPLESFLSRSLGVQKSL